MSGHLLNLRVLADAAVDDYALLRFEGREAISEPFEYHLEIITTGVPSLSGWIGKLVEFDVSPHDGIQRVFAGRIYGAKLTVSGEFSRVFLEVRPAYFALAYGRGTYFCQDKTSVDIFNALTADVTGLTKSVSVSPTPPVRGYSVCYDETELDYLARLLAQDGIMYFFTYDRGAGTYRHKMIVTNKAADYVDVPGDPIDFHINSMNGVIDTLSHAFQAGARKFQHHAVNVNKLDTPFTKTTSSSAMFGSVLSRDYQTIGFEAVAEGDVATRAAAHDQHVVQSNDFIEGTSNRPAFCAGGRVEVEGTEGAVPQRMVLTAVTHSAYDPWMLKSADTATYSNSFTAIDATRVFRPAVGTPHRAAPGPLLGTIDDTEAAQGEIIVDDQSRVPVKIATAREYGDTLPKFVWLPVQQQWAHSTHGAQFFPRIGTRVIIDFLYGNPDLPFVSGTVYTPSQKYPFDPASAKTQSGWRSVTEKNGGITQEFRFEDKEGSEEVYLYTGRDYRRLIDNDDWGTVKRDQTLAVERDQFLTVTRDRTVKIDGKQTTDIDKTQTVTVQQKSLLESKQEIELKVGSSTITMKPDGIEIKAIKITIKAEAQLDMSGGATATLKAPKTDVTADAMLTLKGGIVMIN